MEKIRSRTIRNIVPLILAFTTFSLLSFKKEYVRPSVKITYSPDYNDSSKNFRELLSKSDKNNPLSGKFELNPRAKVFTEAYLSRHGKDYEKMKQWCMPYFNLYDHILGSYKLPLELKYLSVIESSLRSGLVSYKGAVGPWQLMPEEAKRFGLNISAYNDERTNFQKSTEAAAKLLNELYDEYGDWLLVIAAYNCGPGGVNKAISKSGSRDFWQLQFYLPEETRNHVKKYIAAHYYFEGSGGWTTLTAQETEDIRKHYQFKQEDSLLLKNYLSIEISGKYNSTIICKNLLIDIKEFNTLNPQFDKVLSEGKTYQLKLPPDKIEVFKMKKQQIVQESVLFLLEKDS